MEVNLSSIERPLSVHDIMRQIAEESAQGNKEPIVTAVSPVTTKESRHGKYKDPEARKAYQRAFMAAKRAQSGK